MQLWKPCEKFNSKQSESKEVLGCIRDDSNTKHIEMPLYKLTNLKISENFVQPDYLVSKW